MFDQVAVASVLQQRLISAHVDTISIIGLLMIFHITIPLTPLAPQSFPVREPNGFLLLKRAQNQRSFHLLSIIQRSQS